jgi:hypothetical protein
MLFRLFENIYGNRFSQNNKSFITIYGIRMNKQRNGKNVDRKKKGNEKVLSHDDPKNLRQLLHDDHSPLGGQ